MKEDTTYVNKFLKGIEKSQIMQVQRWRGSQEIQESIHERSDIHV